MHPPRCLNPKVSVPHWIQLWGWISGLQPFLAFSASTPLQKLKLTWKTHYVPLLLHHLSGCAICYAAGWSWHTQNQIYTTSLSWSPEDAVSQEKVPMDGPSLNHSWGQILTRTSSYSELLLGNWVINVGLAQGLRDTAEKQNKVLSPCCSHVQIKINNFLIVYGYVLRYFLVIIWLFSVLWCYVDEVLIAWVMGSPHWLLLCALPNNQEQISSAEVKYVPDAMAHTFYAELCLTGMQSQRLSSLCNTKILSCCWGTSPWWWRQS